ncbi:MAG: hypothetical protein F9K46_00525 [Anaerolineae bacterium]|nr:MAG: hypothetical protein F9K46_00525 [Anaerolineae bacterium]
MHTKLASGIQKRQSIQLESPFLSSRLNSRLNRFDRAATRFMARYGLRLLSISMGLVFVWFGALKLQSGVSPAEPLIRDTLDFLPRSLIGPLIMLLAVWEVAIGIGFLSGKAKRIVLILLLMQMGGAMSPLILAPERLWETFPAIWTLEGQYVFKDIILISAGLVIGATNRGGGLSAKRLQSQTSSN